MHDRVRSFNFLRKADDPRVFPPALVLSCPFLLEVLIVLCLETGVLLSSDSMPSSVGKILASASVSRDSFDATLPVKLERDFCVASAASAQSLLIGGSCDIKIRLLSA